MKSPGIMCKTIRIGCCAPSNQEQKINERFISGSFTSQMQISYDREHLLNRFQFLKSVSSLIIYKFIKGKQDKIKVRDAGPLYLGFGILCSLCVFFIIIIQWIACNCELCVEHSIYAISKSIKTRTV